MLSRGKLESEVDMTAGRPPKPTELHKLHGTFRKDRHGDREASEEAFQGRPVKPDWLDEDAGQLWDELTSQMVPGKIAKRVDSTQLAVMCRWWARYKYLMDRVEKESFDDEVCDKLEARAKRAWATFDSIASRFGMTPSDRAKLRLKQDKNEDDHFGEFGIVG